MEAVISYSFVASGLSWQFVQAVLVVKAGEQVPAISTLFLPAFLAADIATAGARIG